MKKLLPLLAVLMALIPAAAEAGRVQQYFLKGYRLKGTTQARCTWCRPEFHADSSTTLDSLGVISTGASATFTSGWFPVFGAKQVVFQMVTDNSNTDSTFAISIATIDTTGGFAPRAKTAYTSAAEDSVFYGVGIYASTASGGFGTPGGMAWARSNARSVVVVPGSGTNAAFPYIPARWMRVTLRSKANSDTPSSVVLSGIKLMASVFYDNDWLQPSVPQ